ncbi:hypothetical protein MTZ49_13440 [Entomomonas sp. E2T0]|uniref:hypothetical protein n=1 Tax=Entomomonas sp. E2T0 TaxID=2930213 RepID=UPI0022283622|nr:hypothetical protein [Entomomonas sp. E2T0]UYZ83588.1 hypothetical protein MTZ49_13440 [Entomomonas sp. E2T0]
MKKIIIVLFALSCSLLSMQAFAAVQWDNMGWIYSQYESQSFDKKTNYRICNYRHTNKGFGGGDIITQVTYTANAPFKPQFCPPTRWVNW